MTHIVAVAQALAFIVGNAVLPARVIASVQFRQNDKAPPFYGCEVLNAGEDGLLAFVSFDQRPRLNQRVAAGPFFLVTHGINSLGWWNPHRIRKV